MTRRTIAAISFAVVLGAGAVAAAQTQPAPQTPASPPAHGGGCPMMSGGGMMGMMGGSGMMGGGMMGMASDARTMQMRGEMMKAMGDIMVKYGKMMEGQR